MRCRQERPGISGRSARVRPGHVGGALLVVLLLAGPLAAGPAPEALGPAARAVLPAVVTITIPSDPGRSDLAEEGTPGAELFHDLFGEVRRGAPRQPIAVGVILHPAGLVLTAAHAVSEDIDIEATTADGLTRKAAVVGLDRKTDLAVLRLSGPGPFAHAALGDSDAVRVGDRVVAIGAPYGLGATVTAGIISATPRLRAGARVDDLFQTDAATFVDGAGGPLVNVRGEVIGFTTVFTTSDFGISFALPSNPARRIFARLVREGEVARGSLDARVQLLTPGLARAFGVPERLNQQPVRTIGDFERLVDGVRPGDRIAILVQRGRLALYVAVVAGSG